MVRPVLAVALALVTAACASSGAATEPGAVSVVASTNVYADIVKQVAGPLAGSRVRIDAIIAAPDTDPHSYEANVRDELAISRADLIIENGGGYDSFVDRMRRSSGTRAPVLDAVALSGRKATQGAPLNEHVWYDFATVATVAARVRDALSAADRPDARAFAAHTATFLRRLQALEGVEARLRAAHAGTKAAITEPVAQYLLTACGLVDVTPAAFSDAVEEGSDVSGAVMHATLQLFTRRQAAVLVYNEQTTGVETNRAIAAAKSHGVPAVAVTETLPAGDSYLSWMTGNLAALQKALS